MLALCAVAPSPATAQAAGDSIAARLRRLEATVATLERQVAEQSESGVRTTSGAKLVLSGRVAVNAFGNSRRVNNVDDPQFVLPDVASGIGQRGGGMTARHTRLHVGLSGGELLGTRTTAAMSVDFYGGQVPSTGGRHFPLVRLRTLDATVRWSRAELLVGQESPLVSMRNPETPAAIGTPLFATAGNLWLWLPQLRVTAVTGTRARIGIQAAVLAPTSGDAAGPHDTDYDLAESSSRPYLQGRAFARFGDPAGDGRGGEVGCGVHHGWLVPTTDRTSSSALACDLLLAVSPVTDLRGEFFTGQSLRGLGGGGIGQNFVGAANDPVETTGGWAQANLAPLAGVRTGVGCGADHPRGATTRRRNDACAAYVSVQPPGAWFVGAEFRRLRTEYPSGRYTNDHVTLALGFGF